MGGNAVYGKLVLNRKGYNGKQTKYVLSSATTKVFQLNSIHLRQKIFIRV